MTPTWRWRQIRSSNAAAVCAQDIRELCPALSVSSIEGSLRKLVAKGELRREGSGRATVYVRLK